MTSIRSISFCDNATRSCFIPKYHPKTCLPRRGVTLSLINDKAPPNPQVAMALSALKPVVVQVKPILTFHPSGAAENVQNRFPTHVKNFACGLGEEPKPRVATGSSKVKCVGTVLYNVGWAPLRSPWKVCVPTRFCQRLSHSCRLLEVAFAEQCRLPPSRMKGA